MPLDFDRTDRAIATFMRRYGMTALRVSLGIIFIWFGILKPLGLSPAAPLVEETVGWMPLLAPSAWVAVIGWWEVAIGVAFLVPALTRVAIALLFLQMVGTFMPLVLLPEVTFQPGRVPYAPTMEGQYIIKNLLIISAALVIGGTVRPRGEPTEAA
jgi:uncharacterized membrane protein YphA (DoxX/SURF4 family)